MKKEQKHESCTEMNRRGFLKRATLSGTALYLTPALVKVTATEKSLTGQSPVASGETNAGMAAIRDYRTLGNGSAAMKVSAMGFGCMGLNYHRGRHPDEQMAIRIVHEAIERGVTLFDIAESYGPYTNELLVGKALKGYTGNVFVTSKFGHKHVNGVRVMAEEDSSPANIRKVCEESLQRLGVETLGMFYQHRSDPDTPIEVVADTVRELIKEGKVLHFGLCEVNADTIRRAHTIQPITAIQSEYHLMFRQPEQNVLPVCEELGIGFVPYSPLNRGFLGGSLNEYTRFDTSNDNRPTLPRFTPEALRANLRIVEVLTDFGRTRGLTGAQIAQAWLLNKKPWIVPITGTTKLSHLEENLRAVQIVFTADEMRELEDTVAAIPIVGSRYNAEQQAKVQQ